MKLFHGLGVSLDFDSSILKSSSTPINNLQKYKDLNEVSSLLLEKNVESKIITINEDEDILLNVNSEGLFLKVVVEEGCRANVTVVSSIPCIVQKVGVVKKGSSLVWHDINLSSSVSRTDSFLQEDGASCKHNLSFLGNDDEVLSLKSIVHHEHSNTHSFMNMKGASSGSSRCVVHGIIRANGKAQNSTGIQKESTLLLSDKAQLSTLPELEIDTEDVRCSHSATTGGLSREKLFYLMSRGLSELDAKRLVVSGFFEEEMKFLDDKTKDLVQKKIEVCL